MRNVDNSSGAAQHSELPVACTLGASDGPERMKRWQQLHRITAPTTQLSSGQLEVRFQPGPEVLAELMDLVAAERVCCAFVNWAVLEDGGQPVLRVTAPPDSPRDVEPIAAMFGVTDGARVRDSSSAIVSIDP